MVRFHTRFEDDKLAKEHQTVLPCQSKSLRNWSKYCIDGDCIVARLAQLREYVSVHSEAMSPSPSILITVSSWEPRENLMHLDAMREYEEEHPEVKP